MLSKLFFFIKRKIRYNNFHKKWKFSQNEISKILHKVKYNIPEIYDEKLDIKTLENSGLKIDKPLYVEFAKKLNFDYAKNLWLAQKIFDFNLVVFYNDNNNILPYQKFLKSAKFFNLSEVSARVKSAIFNLNINQKHLSNFDINNKNKIEINNNDFVVKKFENFTLKSQCEICKNIVDLEQTYFNGNYYFFNNLIKNNKKIIILIKKIIKNNYFQYILLKNNKNQYILYNFSTKEKLCILSNLTIKKVELLKVKSSTNNAFIIEVLCTINCQEISNFFVYIGAEQINIKDKNIKEKILFAVKNNFNIKINSNNSKLNYFFNNYLPNRIILENINDKICSKNSCQNLTKNNKNFEGIWALYRAKKIDAFETYICIKNLLFSWQKNLLVFKPNFLKNFMFEMFINGIKKKFNVSSSLNKKIVVGGVEYINCNSISKNLLLIENVFDVYM